MVFVRVRSLWIINVLFKNVIKTLCMNGKRNKSHSIWERPDYPEKYKLPMKRRHGSENAMPGKLHRDERATWCVELWRKEVYSLCFYPTGIHVFVCIETRSIVLPVFYLWNCIVIFTTHELVWSLKICITLFKMYLWCNNWAPHVKELSVTHGL